MKHLIAPLENGKHYHIYNRGINGEKLFKEQTNFEYFLNLYTQHIDPIAETFSWCLMSNHFHFIVRIKSREEFSENNIQPSQSFSNLFNSYTKAFNKKYHRHGALFERPFRRKLVENEVYFKNLIAYIHNNPVHHHNYCEHPIEYPWSSYITCISEKPTKLKRDEVIDLFGNPDNFEYIHQLKSYDIPTDFF